MADSIYTLDPVAANNTSLDTIPYGPNQLYHNQIDNLFRAINAKTAQFVDDLGGVNTVGGTANAITVTLASGITAYPNGLIFAAQITSANTTTTPTINVNSIGAKTIKKYDNSGVLVALAVNDNAPGIRRYEYLSSPDCIVLLNPAQDGPYPTGHLYGLTLSNNASDATNDIDIAAGTARDGSDAVNMVLAAALTKRLDAAWAVGTGNGGLDTGSIANTTYHVWLIKRSDTGVVDALFSASASAPTMPTNYDYKRRIGSVIRESAAIVAFSQNGDEFLRSLSSNDVGDTSPGTSAVTRTLAVPNGIVVTAIVNVYLEVGSASAASGCVAYISSPAQSDEAPSIGVAPLGTVGVARQAASNFASVNLRVRTANDRTVRSRLSQSNADITLRIATLGWVDTRGRI